MGPENAFPCVPVFKAKTASRFVAFRQNPVSKFSGCVALAVAMASAAGVVPAALADPPPAKKIMFFDDEDVHHRSGTRRQLHELTKVDVNGSRRNSASVTIPYKCGLLPYYVGTGTARGTGHYPGTYARKTWEASIGFVCVQRNPDTGIYQMWYQGFSGKKSSDKRKQSNVCYAESLDGVIWYRPGLEPAGEIPASLTQTINVYDFVENVGANYVTIPPPNPNDVTVNGTGYKYHPASTTNIVMIGSGGYGDRYGNCVLMLTGSLSASDPDPNKRPDRRYKMVHTDWAYTSTNGVVTHPSTFPQMSGTFRTAAQPNNANYDRSNPLGNPYPDADNIGSGTQVAFSSDGKAWTKFTSPVFSGSGFPGPAVLHPILFGGGVNAPTLNAHASNPQDAVITSAGAHTWNRPITMSDGQDAFFDPVRNKYVITGKLWEVSPTGKLAWKHAMGWMESSDFINWGPAEPILSIDDGDNKVTVARKFHTSPVFYYDGMYLCLNQIYRQDSYVGPADDETNETIDIELMSSRDGKRWDRNFREQPFLRRGLCDITKPEGSEDYYVDFDSKAIISNSTPVVLPGEIRFYYGGTGWKTSVGLAKIQRDRMVGVKADHTAGADKIGQVTLKPIDLTGYTTLAVNAKADTGGEVRVELLNSEGKPFQAYLKGAATALTGDPLSTPDSLPDEPLSRKVKWGSTTALPQQVCLIRVHLKNAELYSVSLKP